MMGEVEFEILNILLCTLTKLVVYSILPPRGRPQNNPQIVQTVRDCFPLQNSLMYNMYQCLVYKCV